MGSTVNRVTCFCKNDFPGVSILRTQPSARPFKSSLCTAAKGMDILAAPGLPGTSRLTRPPSTTQPRGTPAAPRDPALGQAGQLQGESNVPAQGGVGPLGTWPGLCGQRWGRPAAAAPHGSRWGPQPMWAKGDGAQGCPQRLWAVDPEVQWTLRLSKGRFLTLNLEAATKIREAGGFGSSPGHLGPAAVGSGILGWPPCVMGGLQAPRPCSELRAGGHACGLCPHLCPLSPLTTSPAFHEHVANVGNVALCLLTHKKRGFGVHDP